LHGYDLLRRLLGVLDLKVCGLSSIDVSARRWEQSVQIRLVLSGSIVSHSLHGRSSPLDIRSFVKIIGCLNRLLGLLRLQCLSRHVLNKQGHCLNLLLRGTPPSARQQVVDQYTFRRNLRHISLIDKKKIKNKFYFLED
jgi:hypothetical protein